MARHAADWPQVRFRAMGTDCLVAVEPGPGSDVALGGARALVDELESRMSRFRPGSELSRLNARGGGLPSRTLSAVLRLAFRLGYETGGLFDPTLLDELETAGYDRSYGDLPPCEVHGAAWDADTDESPRTGVTFDGTELCLPAGTRLDLGGIGKGYAADEVIATFGATRGILVDLGGDIAVSPPGPYRGGWPLGVTHASRLGTVVVAGGAIATSTTRFRTWQGPDGPRHHLLDPRTRRSTHSDLDWVTAFDASCAVADVWAKAVLIAGWEDGSRLARARGIRVTGTLLDGTTVETRPSDGQDQPEGSRPNRFSSLVLESAPAGGSTGAWK